MRRIEYREMRQRGCEYCLDFGRARLEEGERICKVCKHDVCPHHELDNVKSYGAYLRKARTREDTIANYIRKLFEM